MAVRALVIDANILIRATLGIRARNIIKTYSTSVALCVPEPAWRDARDSGQRDSGQTEGFGTDCQRDSGQTAMSPPHRARAFGVWMNHVGSILHRFSTVASLAMLGCSITPRM